MQSRPERRPAAAAILVNLACVLLLMWPALINRQPFFFPDTTSYVRSTDIGVFWASGGRIATAWTARYRSAFEAAQAPQPVAPKPAVSVRPGNDVGSGNIMSGRSPYFGTLLYLGYLTSDFWLFVLAQAVVAYWLIRLSFRLMEVARRRWIVAGVAFLALTTSLPFYNSLLLADALAGFGIVALLLLAIDRGRLGSGERWSLVALMMVSAVSHLTHIIILFAMTIVLALVGMVWRSLWPAYRFAMAAGIAAVIVGLLSVSLTSLMVARTFHHPPQLVPLLTSRVIEEGPGRDFIRAGCDGGRFAVCTVPGADSLTANDFLWSTKPGHGVFMLVDPATRRQLSAQDTQFALAVFRAYPGRFVGGMLRGMVAQLVNFRNSGLAQDCFAWPNCWDSLPARERSNLRASLAGRGLWPIRLLNILHYGVVIGSLLFILAGLPMLRRSASSTVGDLRLWLALILVAMLANAFVCGAVSIPQYRYQGRIVWLLPFYAMLLLLVMRSSGRMPAGWRKIPATSSDR